MGGEQGRTPPRPAPPQPTPTLTATSPTRYDGSHEEGSGGGGGGFLTLSPNGIQYRVTEERDPAESWRSYFLALLKVAGPGVLVAVGYFDPG